MASVQALMASPPMEPGEMAKMASTLEALASALALVDLREADLERWQASKH
jgi:hypothetical protein